VSDAPEPYRYRLVLDALDADLATFRYVEAPLPQADDTRLELNRPSWQALGSPLAVEVTIEPVPPSAVRRSL
jgi:hypothetical protein